MTDFKPIYDILDSIELPDGEYYNGIAVEGFNTAIEMIRDRIEQLDVEETKDYLKDNSAHWIISSDGVGIVSPFDCDDLIERIKQDHGIDLVKEIQCQSCTMRKRTH